MYLVIPKEKTLHQLISNIHAIAELFLVPKTWMKHFVISPIFSHIRVSYCFSKTYVEGGGRFSPYCHQLSSDFFLSTFPTFSNFYPCILHLRIFLFKQGTCLCVPTCPQAGLCLSAFICEKRSNYSRFFCGYHRFSAYHKKAADRPWQVKCRRQQFKAQTYGNVSSILRYLLRGRLSTIL